MDNAPDDDQYDTEDSFIDDAELVITYIFFLFLNFLHAVTSEVAFKSFILAWRSSLFHFMMFLCYPLCRMNILKLIILQ